MPLKTLSGLKNKQNHRKNSVVELTTRPMTFTESETVRVLHCGSVEDSVVEVFQLRVGLTKFRVAVVFISSFLQGTIVLVLRELLAVYLRAKGKEGERHLKV